jgi:hypothetical protein
MNGKNLRKKPESLGPEKQIWKYWVVASASESESFGPKAMRKIKNGNCFQTNNPEKIVQYCLFYHHLQFVPIAARLPDRRKQMFGIHHVIAEFFQYRSKIFTPKKHN